MEKFITVIHYTLDGKRYVVHYENIKSNCIDAVAYSKTLAAKISSRAKDVKIDTYFMGVPNYAIREEIPSCPN